MATLRIPLESPPVEVGAPLSLVGWGALAEVLGAAPRSQDVSPSAQGPMGHSPPVCALCVHFLGLFAITSHLYYFQARLLGTLAVSRGLGDHQLRVLDTNIQLKPFLLSVPQVRGPQHFHLPSKADNARLAGARKGAVRRPQTYLAGDCAQYGPAGAPGGGCGCHGN